MAVNTPLLRSS